MRSVLTTLAIAVVLLMCRHLKPRLALIAEVNKKRKARFEMAAQKTGTTLAQVQNRFYELAVQKTHAGHYYQNSGGKWVKK